MVCLNHVNHLSSSPSFSPPSLFPDVEVGLEMGRLVQQSREKASLSQRELAVVSEHVVTVGGRGH